MFVELNSSFQFMSSQSVSVREMIKHKFLFFYVMWIAE